MIRRSILLSLLFCSSSLLICTQEQAPPSQPTLKKISAFFRTKKGKALIAATMVLLGGTAVWYWRGGSGMRLQEWENNAVQSWQTTFGTNTAISCMYFYEANDHLTIRLRPQKSGLCSVLSNAYANRKNREEYLDNLAKQVWKTNPNAQITVIFGWLRERDGKFVTLETHIKKKRG